MGGGREDTDGHQPVSDAPSSRGRCSADAGAHPAGCGPGGQPAAVPAAAHGDTSGRKSRRRGRDGAGRDGGTTGISDEEQGAEAGRSKMPRRSSGTAHHAQRIDADTILSDGDPGCEGDPLMESVVKVFCVHCEPNFSLPWQRKRQFSSSSTGFVYSLAQRRILTNAHSVDHHTQVKVKKRGSDKKYVAKVLAMGAECDLALLTVEDDSFWTGVKEVRFGGLPRLQDSVIVVGFPIGGDTVSVTSGVVSRIEVTSYVHGAAELLGVQIDAAINAGNSGGPAFNARGHCVGIAFQSLRHEDAENIGYIIPPPVADHFIRDYERSGDYSGFPVLGVDWQKMESVHLRSALKMQLDQSGVLVRRVQPTSPLSQVVKQFDILMKFDGVVIANDGTVPFRSGERISFSYLVSQKYVGEEATLQIYSDGKVKEVTMKLDLPTRLIPFHIRNKPPAFFIIAGLVFTSVTVPYLRSEYGKDYDFDAPVSLLNRMIHHHADVPGQQVVVLGQVLAAELNIGYEDFTNCQVMKLNGAKVHNLKELVDLVDGCTEPWLHFDLDHNQKVILPTQDARNATNPILAAHCIPSDRSNHLLDSSCTAAAAAPDTSTCPAPATQPAAHMDASLSA